MQLKFQISLLFACVQALEAGFDVDVVKFNLLLVELFLLLQTTQSRLQQQQLLQMQ
jgi:hypothetical protein